MESLMSSDSRRWRSPDPIGHEVLVRNTVIGLNSVDIYYRRGTLPVPEFPTIIGDEAAGVVEAIGPNLTLQVTRCQSLEQPARCLIVRYPIGNYCKAILRIETHSRVRTERIRVGDPVPNLHQIPSGTPNLFRNLRAIAEILVGTKRHKLERVSFDHQHGCPRVDLFLTESTSFPNHSPFSIDTCATWSPIF
jgi:hypothetical protein